MLCIVFWLAAAASFSGYIGKYALRDGSAEFGIINMLNGSAEQPFVYRQLAPLIAHTIAVNTPHQTRNTFAKLFNPEQVFSAVSRGG